ncbi:MAG TPA: hypothetical protein VGL61_22925 [Kofleriaceae bacterium]|jgi:hypothetical protein
MRTLCLAAVLLAACRGDYNSKALTAMEGAPVGREPIVVPRSHQIPPGHAAEVRRLFEAQVITFPISVVSSAGTNTQFVNPKPSFLGNDRFVIAATPEIHDELDRMLAAMAKEPAPVRQVTYAVTYWAVEADPSASVEIPAGLEEVKPVLESLKALGPRKFKIIDRAATHSLDGVKAGIKSRELDIQQTLSSDADGVQLALELELNDKPPGYPSNAKVNTKLEIALDKPLVLAEAAMEAGSDTPPENLVLFVVKARAE